jgi:hypothetical protein
MRAEFLKHAASACLFLMAGQALADTPLDGAAFGALTTGKTIVFDVDGAPYGAEEYLPDNRVRWSFLDGNCLEGRWFQKGEAICFVYEDQPDEHCWLFYEEASGALSARLAELGAESRYYGMLEQREPLYCKGPLVGV